jgi:GTP-binding protein
MYNYLKYYNIPVTIIATKSDKVSKNNYEKNKKIIRESLNLSPEDSIIVFSSQTKQGKEEVHNQIESLL